MDFSPEELLAFVCRSPERVAAHDRAGWLELFSADAIVEDPVGSRPARKGKGARGTAGDDELARFYETFIAPNDVRFEPMLDVMSATCVARDVQIHTKLSNGFAIVVPAYLLYEIEHASAQLKIRRMAAHWELPRMLSTALTGGLRGAVALSANTGNVLRNQGIAGMVGFTRALTLGVFEDGRRAVRQFGAAIRARDVSALREIFAPEANAILGDDERVVRAETLLDMFGTGSFEPIEPRSAGYATAFRFAHGDPKAPSFGIGFFDFDPRSKRVVNARLLGNLGAPRGTTTRSTQPRWPSGHDGR